MKMSTLTFPKERSAANAAANIGRPKSFDELLGVNAADPLQLVRAVERGFAFSTLERIKKATNIPMEQLAVSIGISQRTLTRRRKEKKLTASESDRLVSISRLLTLAVDLFEGDGSKAFAWFLKPNRALGGMTPLAMATTETGAREVENLIGRLEHGVFT